jgi:adenylosuccinate lyase
MTFDYETYLSPFTWRYGSAEMRRLWSEAHKRSLWRQVWVALAETQAEYGLVTAEQAADLKAHAEQIDVPRSLEIEAQIHHDLMAELRLFAEQAPLGGGVLHLGATSTDIEDNADVLRLRVNDLLLPGLEALLVRFAGKIEAFADLPLIAFTHLQPAEPSTLGYRLAQYAQDLSTDREALRSCRASLRGKGFKGAVGTAAAYAELVGADRLEEFEQKLSARLELHFFPVATQVYPRKQDYQIVSAWLGSDSLHKFAFDLRKNHRRWASLKPSACAVGSSAMPFAQPDQRREDRFAETSAGKCAPGLG